MSNTIVTGVVKKIWENERTNDKGTYFAYSIVLEDGTKVSAGFKKPDCLEGDTIQCMTDGGQYNNMIKGSLSVTNHSGNPSPPSQQATSAPAPQKVASAGGGGGNRTQTAIQHQAARNSALHLVEIAVAAGVAPLPKKDGFDALTALVDEVTLRYFTATQDVADHGGVDHLMDIGEGNAFDE